MRRTSRRALAIAAATLVSSFSTSWSSPTSSEPQSGTSASLPEIEGDPAYGEYLSSECLTCHRSDGANDGIPSITGWPRADFVAAMQAYKNKRRKNSVMQLVAGKFSDDEFAALAAYFEQLDAR